MCGIAGIGGIEFQVDPQWIQQMTDALAHRGPDDEGYLAIDTNGQRVVHLTGKDSKVNGPSIDRSIDMADVFLGHRRLSILDPTPAGHQPMSTPDGKIWIVYNGEIYNYIELRDELKQRGHRFRTTTDTEIILAAYERWGQKCLAHFDGMWSFVIYDQRKNILFGARDRFGVKPFYYYKDSSYFAFASEVKSLLTLPFITKQLNTEALFDFMVFNGLPFMEEGFFKGINELQPAHAFIYYLENGHFSKWKYFTLRYNRKPDGFEKENSLRYIEDIREKLTHAVKLRLRSDVPLGSALSGGIDSSAIVCIISQLMTIDSSLEGPLSEALNGGFRQKVFTASFPGTSIDESDWAKLAAERSNARWHQTFPKAEEYLADIEDLAYTQEIPYGSPSVYAQYRVMKLAKENDVKVILDGQGADELFTGYTMYYDVFFYQLLKQFNIKTLANEFLHLGNAPVNYKEMLLALFKQARRQIVPYRFIKKYRTGQTNRFHHRYISEDFWEANKNRFDLIRDRDFKSLNNMLFEYFTRQKLSNLLKYEDRNSMRFSVESRTPFADHLGLIQYVFNIPAAYKIHNGWSKYLLREAMKGILPEEIRVRKDKKGFFVPDLQWLTQLKRELSDYITDDMKEFLNIPLIKTHLDKDMAGANPETIRAMWNIISFAVWKKVFDI
ncbi:MAG: asparagine synthase (glutamine-hydrolyzing) [bacterium]|nr:asparagine synthase (glutamine-hydrolyzing) [bacterium]